MNCRGLEALRAMKLAGFAGGFIALGLLAGCGGTSSTGSLPQGASGVGHYKLGSPYQVAGRWYTPRYESSHRSEGIASWYGHPFHGRATANGEIFDRNGLTAAHPTLPLPSIVEVTNLENGRSIKLRVNDRGPFVGDRMIDLSQAAARKLGFEEQGLAKVRVEFIGLADATGSPPIPEPVLLVAPKREAPIRVAKVASSPPAACLVETTVVQVVALGDRASAYRLAEQLASFGGARVSEAEVNGRRLARVQVGPLKADAQVERVLGQLRERGYDEAFVTTADYHRPGCSRV